MRNRRPTQNNGGGYNNQQRRPRYQQGGGGSSGGHHQHGGNRPRKNYGASREKYLMQARDAMASGDRVMAEYFYQHADHCYRMMMEEGSAPRPQQAQNQPQENMQEGNQDNGQADAIIQPNTNALPSFITANYEGGGQPKPVDPGTIQNWEERDA